ncbi:AfsA-related hotdog domain-containing protein [Kitasatospora sp. NPDC058965]|uniref:AfsA-related hotdog domain-containing protein n=1 Tax=Kitasatospora sp. NPDC058965 TaxID=3346682 RepID=UPI0036ABCE1D
MLQDGLGDVLERGTAIRHLVHQSPDWDRYLLETPSTGEERFTLAGRMPDHHPLFNDGPGTFHDLQVVAELIGELGEFVGQRYFGIAAARTGLCYRFDLAVTELDHWRVEPAGNRLTTRLRVLPVHEFGGAPRSLAFHYELEMDGAPCCTGSADIVFLTPVLSRSYSRLSRGRALALLQQQDAEDPPRLSTEPVAPLLVGRGKPANVLVAEPALLTGPRLVTQVLVPESHPAFPEQQHTPGLLLLEAVRQAALLAAGQVRGLDPERSTLAGVRMHHRGYAEPDLPLRCSVLPGVLERDTAGRPVVPLTLTLTQHGRTVAQAGATVVQDF